MTEDARADDDASAAARSYRALTAEAATLFRLLGLHPGPAFGVPAAAAIARLSTAQAHQLLDSLAGAHLLEQTAPDRYEFHDLLRPYATDRAQHEETPETRAAAVRRILTWYVHTADAAQGWINPGEAHIPLSPLDAGVDALTFDGYEQAMAWYELESTNLMAVAREAEAAGLDEIAWQLAAVLRSVHMLLNPFEDWLAMGHIGLRAARRLGDRGAEAEILESLGMACTHSHRLPEAADFHEAALSIRRERGDRLGESLSLNDIGLIRLRERRLSDAKSYFDEALTIFLEIGAPQWEAVALANAAEVAYELGAADQARDLAQSALEKFRALDNKGGQGNVLRLLSASCLEQGEPRETLGYARQAVDIALSHRNIMWEGYWLLTLGRAQQATGHAEDALASYERAAVIQRRLGDRSREARAWQGAGEAYQRLERFEEAADFHRGAAATHRDLNDDWQLALALDGLAGALHAAGRTDEACTHWSEALTLTARYEDPRAADLHTRISRALEQA